MRSPHPGKECRKPGVPGLGLLQPAPGEGMDLLQRPGRPARPAPLLPAPLLQLPLRLGHRDRQGRGQEAALRLPGHLQEGGGTVQLRSPGSLSSLLSPHRAKLSPLSQVFRRQGGWREKKRVLLVPPGKTAWSISDSVEATGGFIQSCAASECPASDRAGHSDRFGQKCWQYGLGEKGWIAGDITVTCSSHSYRE